MDADDSAAHSGRPPLGRGGTYSCCLAVAALVDRRPGDRAADAGARQRLCPGDQCCRSAADAQSEAHQGSLALARADDDADPRRCGSTNCGNRLANGPSNTMHWSKAIDSLGFARFAPPNWTPSGKKLAPHYEAMVAAAREIIHAGGDADSSDAARSPTAALVEHEAQFLPTMDRIVKLMEDEAAKAVLRLRASALAIAALIVAAAGRTRLVCRAPGDAHDSLASSTSWKRASPQRTAELAAALESLRREVHEREDAELKNQRLAAQLTHAERVTTMGHLTAGLAHELNQPLAAITNYTEACDVLLENVPAVRANLPESASWSIKAKRAALRAGQIVRRMRNFVRPNAATQIAGRHQRPGLAKSSNSVARK